MAEHEQFSEREVQALLEESQRAWQTILKRFTRARANGRYTPFRLTDDEVRAFIPEIIMREMGPVVARSRAVDDEETDFAFFRNEADAMSDEVDSELFGMSMKREMTNKEVVILVDFLVNNNLFRDRDLANTVGKEIAERIMRLLPKMGIKFIIFDPKSISDIVAELNRRAPVPLQEMSTDFIREHGLVGVLHRDKYASLYQFGQEDTSTALS